jgi:hypothetical protein
VVKNRFPSHLCQVIATEIVPLLRHLLEMRRLAAALLGLNVMTVRSDLPLPILRVLWVRQLALSDLADQQRGHGSSLSIWPVPASSATPDLGGTILYSVHDPDNKLALHDGITGAWLPARLANQSLVVVSA